MSKYMQIVSVFKFSSIMLSERSYSSSSVFLLYQRNFFTVLITFLIVLISFIAFPHSSE